MTWTTTTAESFATESLTGFSAAHSDLVDPVDGGVVLKSRTPGQVAVVVGGGSGHYPAFAGLVGPGLASAAVCGDIFASPSAGQVFRVTQAAEMGAGAVLMYGNYMGDVLNFSQAQEKLRSVGMDVRSVRVTDDVASAPVAEKHKRRGVAGDLFVFKIAGAAASRGDSIDEVERLAKRANDAAYSFGVAFDGCTLPGATEPLFSVPVDTMSLGLGVHGEPGIGEAPLPTPQQLAEALVSRLLDEPAALPGSRITVLLNGLGTFKYEELFAVYGFVDTLLRDKGFDIIRPEVGELVTSLDMAGCSLTIAWLDDELESLWVADCDAPGFSRQQRVYTEDTQATRVTDQTVGKTFIEPENSADYVALVREIFSAIADEMASAEKELGELDAKTGDGDHGIGMARGSRAARDATRDDSAAGVVALLSAAADGWSEAGGGTSGAIWGILLGSIATGLSRQETISASSLAHAISSAADTVQNIGGAHVGDKTLVDTLIPFSNHLGDLVAAGNSLDQAWEQAAEAAQRAAEQTADLTPRIGRAAVHTQASQGIPDAGAISMARIILRVGETMRKGRQS